MCSDTDEEGPPPAAPVAELLPAALQEVLQGTSLDEMVDVFTMEAWGKLDEMQRMHLGALLPPGNRDEAVRALFGRDQLQLCPPPLDRFWRQMSAGDFSFEGQRRAQELELSRRRELVAQMREHHNNTVHKLHYLRRTWSCPPPQPPQPKNSGHSGEVLVYNKQGGGLVRRSRTAAPGQAPPQLGRPYGSSVGAGTIAGGAPRPKATTRVLATPSGHALGGGKCNSPAQLAAPVQPAGPVHSAAGPGPPGGAPLVGAGGHMAAAGGEDEGAGGGWNCPSHLQVLSSSMDDSGDEAEEVLDEALPPHLPPPPGKKARHGARAPSAASATAPPHPGAACSTGAAFGSAAAAAPLGLLPAELPEGFAPELQIFRLVRDAIASVPQALAPAEYVRKQVQVQAEGLGIMGKLPKGATLSQYLRSALTFLSMSKEEHAARTQRSGSPLELLALAPYLTFDDSTQSFRWLGTAAASTDAALLPLDALHFERFASAHGGPYSGGGGLRSLHAPPMKANKGGLSLPPGSAEQLATMRRQELERFEQPDQPYTYTLRDGSASAVAPIGKKSSGGKARDHFLLRQDRPPVVTLLALVRDAAARLPGGEGSRADVCELLKESQFVLDGVHDAQISQVASGALDRLHQEADACVRYDSERKLWIYLHAQRAPADFPSFKAPQRKPPTGGAGGSLVPVAVPAPHGGPQMRM